MSDDSKFASGAPPKDAPQKEMTCSEFDARLSEAIDDALEAEILERFERHGSSCTNCGPLLAEVRQGLAWLETLEDVEPPANLVHNILARTSHADRRPSKASSAELAGSRPQSEQNSFWPRWLAFPNALRFRQSPGQPGFVTTLGMAFFSITLLFNVAGVKVSHLGSIDLRPSSIRKAAVQQYSAATARLVRYYSNTQLVYEVVSKLQELRRAASGNEEPNKTEPKPETKPPGKLLNQDRNASPVIGQQQDQDGDGLKAKSIVSERRTFPGGATIAALSSREETARIVRIVV